MNINCHCGQLVVIGVNLAGILGYAEADPEGLFGARGDVWDGDTLHTGKGVGEGAPLLHRKK